MAQKCFVCHQHFVDKFVESNSLQFHNECFKCSICLVSIVQSPFTLKNDKLYCLDDYYSKFGDKCVVCNEIIKENILTAFGMKFHKEHFNCSQCGKNLPKKAVELDGKIYCSECTMQTAVEKCSKCHNLINENDLVIILEGKKEHLSHYNCCVCFVPLELNYKIVDGKFYCKLHFDKLMFVKCYVCKETIEGRVIEAAGKEFHPNHFSCCKCGLAFDGKHYVFDDELYCEAHYKSCLGLDCRRCGDRVRGVPIKVGHRYWCFDHFLCTGCDANLDGCLDWDGKPFCKKCYSKIPKQAIK